MLRSPFLVFAVFGLLVLQILLIIVLVVMPVGDANSYLRRKKPRLDDSTERPTPQVHARTAAIMARSDGTVSEVDM